MSLTKVVNNLSNLIALGYADINADDTPANQRFRPGQMGFYSDDYGMKYMRYIKNVSGSTLVLGEAVQRVADVTFTDPDSATAKSIAKAAAFVANAHIGKVLIYETNASAGAAPEGESAIISSNTAGVLTLDDMYPFSAAPGHAASDAFRIWGPWHGDAAGDAVIAENVLGVVMAISGISNGNYGWALFQGVMPLTKITPAAAIAAGVAVVTKSGGVLQTIGANAGDTVVGYALAAAASTNSGHYPVFWSLGAVGGVSL